MKAGNRKMSGYCALIAMTSIQTGLYFFILPETPNKLLRILGVGCFGLAVLVSLLAIVAMIPQPIEEKEDKKEVGSDGPVE